MINDEEKHNLKVSAFNKEIWGQWCCFEAGTKGCLLLTPFTKLLYS
jgi:hypothetical protein